MATITFPSNPVLNQIYSYDGNTWIWDGSSWQLLTNAALNAVVIGNVVPESGAFTTLSADTFAANYIVTGPINATTVVANAVAAEALTGTSLSLSGNVLSALHVNAPVTATNFTTTGNVIASGDIVSSSNVTAQYFIGDGSLLTNLPSGGTNYSNANVAAYLPSYTGNLQAGNVSILGNILGNGVSILGRVVASGNITGGNITSSGIISTSGNVAARFLFGDARYLSNVPVSDYGNANVASYLPTYTGDLNASNYTGNGSGLTDIVGANVVGAVANAVYATTAGTAVSVPAANIVGTVANASIAALAGAALAVPGSGVSGAVALANVANTALVANQAYSVAAGNVIGRVANAERALSATTSNTAVTVTANAQPNITSVGVLSSLSVTGTATTGNILARNVTLSGSAVASGNVSAQYFIGNASLLTGLPTLDYSDANVAAYLPTYTGVVGAASITASGNIVGVNVAATNQVSGLTVVATGNVRGGNVLTTGTVSATGNIVGTYLFGDGRHLTNIPQNYSNANVAAYLPTYNGDITAGTLRVIGDSIVSNLYVYGDEFATQNIVAFGNVDSGNLRTQGSVSAAGNVVAPYYFGDGRYLTNLPMGNYSNANVAAYLPTYTGNLSGDVLSINLVNTNSVLTGTVNASGGIVGGSVTALGNVVGGNVNATGFISSTGNIAGRFLFGDGRFLSNIQGNYGNANVAVYLPTYTGTLAPSSISSSGSITGNQIIGSTISASSNVVVGGNVVVTGAVTSNAVVSNTVVATGQISTTGNIVGNFFLGNGRFLSGISTYSNTNVASFLSTYSGDISADNMSLSGDVVGNNIYMYGKVFATSIISAVGNVAGGNLTTAGWVSAQGNVHATYYFGDGRFLTNIPSSYSNVNVAAYLPTYNGNLNPNIISASGNVTAQYFIGNGRQLTGIQATDIGVLPSLSVTGNATIGNVNTVGNVTATYFIGNGSQLTGLPSSYSNANVAAYLPTYTGNLNPNTVSAAGNITGNYVLGNGSQLTGMYSNASVAAYLPTYTGNILANTISATSNITAQYFVGNGSQLTGIQATVVGVLPSLSVTGNTNTGNLNSLGKITADSNIETPGTIFSGNIVNSGTAQINGNVLAGNVNVLGLISSQGNITVNSGNYFVGNGRYLTGLPSSTSYANALVGNTLSSNVLYSSLQQLGILNSLNVSGAINTNSITATGAVVGTTVNTQNLVASGNVSGQYILGNGSQLTGVQATEVGTLPSLSVTGNINIGGYYIGDGGLLTNLQVSTSYANSNVAAFLASGTDTSNIITTANVSGAYLIGNGIAIRSINAANVLGTVANATYAATSGFTNSANLAARITGNAQPNITSVGILTSASISGNVNMGSNLTVVGNIYGNLVGNISANLVVPGANTQILYNYNGNAMANAALTFNQASKVLFVDGVVSATGNIVGNNLFGNAALLSNVPSVLTVSNWSLSNGISNTLANVTTLRFNEDTGITVEQIGNAEALISLGSSFKTWEVDGQANLVAHGEDVVKFVAGPGIVITTDPLAYPQEIAFAANVSNISNGSSNITIVNNGNIRAAVAGTDIVEISGSGVGVVGLVSSTGNITAPYFIGNGSQLTGITNVAPLANLTVTGNIVAGNISTTGLISTTSNVVAGNATFNGNVGIAGNLSVAGNINYVNVTDLVVGDPLIYFAANNTGNLVDIGWVGSYDDGVYQHTGLVRDHTDGTWKLFSNVVAEPTTVIDWANAQYDQFQAGPITSTATISAVGNITTAGNVNGTYFVGNGSALTSVMADRGMDQNNWDTLTQMGVYTVNRVSWSGTQGTPLDSTVYVGILEVKNTTNTGIAQVFYPGTVNGANSQVQWNRSYWSGSWSPWYYIVNNNNLVDAGDF